MFEDEIQLERRSSFMSLILLFSLVAVIVGLVAYVVMDIRAKKDLTAAEAGNVAVAALHAQGPAFVHFHGGTVMPSVDEKPRDPHYRLLQDAGIVNVGKVVGGGLHVTLTPKGESLVTSLPGYKTWKNTDGSVSYTVPLAERQLVQISRVTMTDVNHAVVEYSWKWVPNAVGNFFDASGPLVKKFNTWDRATLIDKYGADFFSGNPTRANLSVMRTRQGWQIATE